MWKTSRIDWWTNEAPIDPAQYLTDAVRHDGWTIARQLDFLDALGALGGVTAAAQAVGMSAQSAYRLRKRCANMAKLWDMAIEEGRLRAFDRALECGLNGYRVPVLRNGRVVGTRHRHDNRLLYAACYAERALKPD